MTTSTTAAPASTLTVSLPLQLVSEPNAREYWRLRARRARMQRATVTAFMRCQHLPVLPVVVTLTRTAPRAFDSDNLAAAFKAVRDGVADAYMLNDRDPRLTWRYSQRREEAYGIEISITPRRRRPCVAVTPKATVENPR